VREIWAIRTDASEIYPPIAKNPCYGWTLYLDDGLKWFYEKLRVYPTLVSEEIDF